MVFVDLNPQDEEKMYHILHTTAPKSNQIKILIAIIALSASVTAAQQFNPDQEAERGRTAKARFVQSHPPQLGAKKTAPTGSSFFSELDLFLRVLASGPFGLYHGWHARKKPPAGLSYKPFQYTFPTKTYTNTRKKPIRRHG